MIRVCGLVIVLFLVPLPLWAAGALVPGNCFVSTCTQSFRFDRKFSVSGIAVEPSVSWFHAKSERESSTSIGFSTGFSHLFVVGGFRIEPYGNFSYARTFPGSNALTTVVGLRVDGVLGVSGEPKLSLDASVASNDEVPFSQAPCVNFNVHLTFPLTDTGKLTVAPDATITMIAGHRPAGRFGISTTLHF